MKGLFRYFSGSNRYIRSLDLTFSLSRKWRLQLSGSLLLLVISSLSAEAYIKPKVHYFDCEECHFNGMVSYYDVANGVCLKCHTDNWNGLTLSANCAD